MNNYQKNKERIRQKAIEWSNNPAEKMSWGELIKITDYFYRQGKRYGLLKEFNVNGIC